MFQQKEDLEKQARFEFGKIISECSIEVEEQDQEGLYQIFKYAFVLGMTKGRDQFMLEIDEVEGNG